MQQQFKIKQLYALPKFYLFVLYLSQRGGLIGSWWGNRRERDHLGSLGVDGLIMLEWISREWMWVCGLEWAGTGYGHVAGSCECGNEHSGSIKCCEYFM